MDVFTRLASGIYLRQPRRGDHRNPQAQRGRRFHGIILQDLRDEELYRKIALANDRVTDARTKYASLRQRRRALRERVQQLDAQLEDQEREMAHVLEFRSKCLDEQKARERDQEGRRRGRARWEQRRAGPGTEWERVRNVKRSPRHSW